jgi:hypothetical protein
MKSFVKFLFLSLFLLLSCQYTLAGSKYVVANVSVAPVREKPSHAAEQATQLLLGELCEVVDRASGWIKIRSTVDGQVGWVTSSMLTSTKKLSSNSPVAVVVTPTAIARPVDGGAPILLTMGTRLFNYSLGTFSVLSKQYHIDPTCVSIPTGKADLQRAGALCAAAVFLRGFATAGGEA